MSIETFALNRLKLSGICSDQSTVRFGSGAGPILYTVCRKRIVVLETNVLPSSPIPPRDSVTHSFNKNQENIKNGETETGNSSFIDWFGGNRDFEIVEEVIGLGGYGKTLTVLTITEDLEDLEEQDELVESWTPRFKR